MQWAHDVIQSGLERLETVATGTAGRYCVKDELSIADACLVPQLYNARRFSVESAEGEHEGDADLASPFGFHKAYRFLSAERVVELLCVVASNYTAGRNGGGSMGGS